MSQYYIEFIKRVKVEPKKNSWNYNLEQDMEYIEAASDDEALDILDSMYSVKEVLLVELV